MWSILFYLLLAGLVFTNIIVGCYAAILMGYGPPDWRSAQELLIDGKGWERIQNRILSWRSGFRSKSKPAPERPTKESTAESAMQSTANAESLQEQPLSMDDIIQQYSTAELSDLLEDDSDDITNLLPMQELFDDELASVLMEQGTESWLMNEKHVETSILKLNVAMMKSGRFAADLDARLRQSKKTATENDLNQFIEELKDDCRNYLESQASISEQMLERLDEFGELKYLAEEIDYANMEQSAQIETTLSNLDHSVKQGGPEEGIGRLIRELASLRIARHRLRDMQERTFMKIVLYEDRLDTVPQQLYIDENTSLRGRIGLDIAVHEWWKQKRFEKRQLTFALLDFVNFGSMNDDHGIHICDKLIRHFGRSLERRFDPSDLVGVYYGNCFLVATVNMGPKKTLAEIERVRQSCEKTTYVFNEKRNSFRVELTCAVTEATATQTRDDVFGVLESTMAAAKKAGRNHTYRFEPSKLNAVPEKVDAPNLAEEAVEVDLDKE